MKICDKQSFRAIWGALLILLFAVLAGCGGESATLATDSIRVERSANVIERLELTQGSDA